MSWSWHGAPWRGWRGFPWKIRPVVHGSRFGGRASFFPHRGWERRKAVLCPGAFSPRGGKENAPGIFPTPAGTRSPAGRPVRAFSLWDALIKVVVDKALLFLALPEVCDAEFAFRVHEDVTDGLDLFGAQGVLLLMGGEDFLGAFAGLSIEIGLPGGGPHVVVPAVHEVVGAEVAEMFEGVHFSDKSTS